MSTFRPVSPVVTASKDDSVLHNILLYGIEGISGSTVLEEHMKEAYTYISNTIQNQLIEITADIKSLMKEAKMVSVLCDEVSDVFNGVEVSIVLRFVVADHKIVLVNFVTSEQISGEVLACKIKRGNN